MLSVNIDFSSGEVKMKHKMLAIKYHPDKCSKRCAFTKEDGMELSKGVVNAFDILK